MQGVKRMLISVSLNLWVRCLRLFKNVDNLIEHHVFYLPKVFSHHFTTILIGFHLKCLLLLLAGISSQ